jgi:hypothetical protein
MCHWVNISVMITTLVTLYAQVCITRLSRIRPAGVYQQGGLRLLFHEPSERAAAIEWWREVPRHDPWFHDRLKRWQRDKPDRAQMVLIDDQQLALSFDMHIEAVDANPLVCRPDGAVGVLALR